MVPRPPSRGLAVIPQESTGGRRAMSGPSRPQRAEGPAAPEPAPDGAQSFAPPHRAPGNPGHDDRHHLPRPDPRAFRGAGLLARARGLPSRRGRGARARLRRDRPTAPRLGRGRGRHLGRRRGRPHRAARRQHRAHAQRPEVLPDVAERAPRRPLPRRGGGHPRPRHRAAPHEALPEARRGRLALPDASGLALLPHRGRQHDRGRHPRLPRDRRDGVPARLARQPQARPDRGGPTDGAPTRRSTPTRSPRPSR